MKMPFTCTDLIESGKITTARDYLMLLTQNHGFMVEYSDESGKVESIAPPESRDRSITLNYYESRLKQEQDILARLNAMTPEEMAAENERLYQEELGNRKAAYGNAVEKSKRYNDILAKVVKWQPGNAYEDFKNEAIKYIEFAKPDVVSYESALKLEKFPDEKWYAELCEESKAAIVRYEKKIELEKLRLKDEQEWFEGLVKSLEKLNE